MKMRLKNAMLLSLAKLFRDTEKVHGIPREIILSPHEGADLLREIAYLKSEIKDGNLKDRTNVLEVISIEHNDHLGTEAKFALQSAKSLKIENVKTFITAWVKGNINVNYKYQGSFVPLTVVSSKAAEKISSKEKKDSENEWG